ncbi:MAG: bis(5nucleosyl)-tetraphosphatase, ApaH, partial [Variovorax sp.]|nr:bis(5nucleosyl)-tetraphosphatase, ApaH [Variovorax sp.]
MALYLIGDVQGCDQALQRLLDTIGFSPSRDTVVLLGDLVNRGPASAQVLRRAQAAGAAMRCLLGNHDLYLLSVAQGVRHPHGKDTIDAILAAPDRDALLDWLRHQSMALHERIGGEDLLMVHAGVLPQWSVTDTLSLASEVEAALRGPTLDEFLRHLYGDEARWSDALRGQERLRVIVNALTRLRFCTPEGVMEFKTKDSSGTGPAGYLPWFDVPGRRTAGATV